jgi:hypothetical protein
MKGIAMMLKALGVEITPEQIAMLQALIPQLPAKVNEAFSTINAALANFDARLRALETRQDEVWVMLQAIRSIAAQTQDNLVEVFKNGNSSGVSDAPGRASGAGRRGAGSDSGSGNTGG